MSTTPDPDAVNVTVRMPALAAEFVEAAKAAGVSLDYLPRTLPIADKFAKSSNAATDRYGAYVAEVVRRETKGFWFEAEGVPMVYAGIEPYVDGVAIVESLKSQNRADVNGTVVESTKAYCELICRIQKQWLDKAVLGTYDSMSALRTAMAADAKTAGLALGLAQTAVLTAKLDWSEELVVGKDSLDEVERMLGAMHTLKNQNSVTSEQIESLCTMMGVFVGEIIRRVYGGQWRVGENGDLELPYPGTTVQPITRARKRVMDGPSENIRMYYASLPKIIASD